MNGAITSPNRRHGKRRWLLAAVVVAVLAAVGLWLMNGSGADRPGYRLAPLERGPIKLVVSASGTLSAVVTVEVGSQVSGQIKELSADYNTEVRAGQVIARLDPAPFTAQVQQAQAEVAVAEANVAVQQASLLEVQAELDGVRAAAEEAEKDLGRQRTLLAQRVVANSLVEKAIAANDQARSRVRAATAKLHKQDAQILNALAQVQQRRAARRREELDLEHSIIRSPVDGVVISRSVDVGQTVAASLQAPTLFTIAQDLSSMQVEVSVDEADIGRVREDQRTTFTVDAFPNLEFPGVVRQIRKAPVEVSSVTTYTVVIGADNADLRLLPGMTANVTIVITEKQDVLKVPNAALRFRPPAGQAGTAADTRTTASPGAGPARVETLMARLNKALALDEAQRRDIRALLEETGRRVRALRKQGLASEEIRAAALKIRAANRAKIAALLTPAQRETYATLTAKRDSAAGQPGRIWLLDDDGNPTPVDIAYGDSDGSAAEILSGDVKAGQQVIIGLAPASSARRGGGLRFGF